jgi:hypothetical protein
MYRVGLSIHLQECLILFPSLLYNELASAAIDQEKMMKAVAEVVLVVLPPSNTWCIPHLGVNYIGHNNSRIGAIAQIPTAAILAATAATTAAAAAVQPCSYPTAIAGCHQASTAIPHQQLSMLQLWEDGPL